jgi:hypothetical protein
MAMPHAPWDQETLPEHLLVERMVAWPEGDDRAQGEARGHGRMDAVSPIGIWYQYERNVCQNISQNEKGKAVWEKPLVCGYLGYPSWSLSCCISSM